MLFEDHRQRSDYDSYKNSEDGDIFLLMQQRSQEVFEGEVERLGLKMCKI